MKNLLTFGFIMFCLLGYSQDLPFLNDENLPSENQSLDILSNYENGIKKITKFHKNGQIISEVTYKNDKPSTNWTYYDENGEVERIDIYRNGKFFYEKHLK